MSDLLPFEEGDRPKTYLCETCLGEGMTPPHEGGYYQGPRGYKELPRPCPECGGEGYVPYCCDHYPACKDWTTH